MWALVLALLLRQPPAAGTLTEHVACLNDPTETYTLYLPPGYAPGVPRPLLLVFDPRRRGTVAASLFREGAERYGWVIVSSDNTRSDGPWEPNGRALQALWPEVHTRYAVDERRIYAAGFSGGATVAWQLSRATGGLAGIIEAGHRIFRTSRLRSCRGRWRCSRRPAASISITGTRSGSMRAIAWLELRAMDTGLRARDEGRAKEIETALERALALGPLDRAALEADARFASLRGNAPFTSLLTRLGKSPHLT